MIRLQRPVAVPDILKKRGRALRADAIKRVRNGDAVEFDRSVYAHDDVKSSLSAAQHDKCCFCESKVSHIAFGDVEHFRPKKAFRNLRGEALTKPGYYWLGYEWTNLVYACQVCNQRHKGNLFPLEPGGVRARTPTADLAAELPLFVDPAADDPAAYIGFRAEFAFPIKGRARGSTTIDALELNRPALVERRRDRLRTLQVLRKAARVCMDVRQEAQLLLREAVADQSEYASAARAALKVPQRTTGAARPRKGAQRKRKPPTRARPTKRSAKA